MFVALNNSLANGCRCHMMRVFTSVVSCSYVNRNSMIIKDLAPKSDRLAPLALIVWLFVALLLICQESHFIIKISYLS